MDRDPVIHCFLDEFERFHDLMVRQIEICPENLWNAKAAGFYFWQQHFHCFWLVELYALPDGHGEPALPAGIDREAAMLAKDPDTPMNKPDMLALAVKARDLATAFMTGLTARDLVRPHARLSRLLNSPRTNQNALIGLIRHYCYHLGCCDSVLRDSGIPGVY